MTPQITATDALELLTRVVKREGRDTIRRCRYVVLNEDHGQCPHCIVACMFVEAGVHPAALSAFEGKTLDELYHNNWLIDVVDLSPDAVSILAEAQEAQDNRLSWGEALAAARRTAWKLGVIGRQREEAADESAD